MKPSFIDWAMATPPEKLSVGVESLEEIVDGVAVEAVSDDKGAHAAAVKRFTESLGSIASTIGKTIEKAADKDYEVHLKGTASGGYHIVVTGTEPKTGKKFSASWKY